MKLHPLKILNWADSYKNVKLYSFLTYNTAVTVVLQLEVKDTILSLSAVFGIATRKSPRDRLTHHLPAILTTGAQGHYFKKSFSPSATLGLKFQLLPWMGGGDYNTLKCIYDHTMCQMLEVPKH